MDKPSMIPILRNVARELERDMDQRLEPVLHNLEREITAPPRQFASDYAPPGDAIDPVVKGLLTHLPATGSVWPEAERKLWLELLAGSFRMIYREAEKPAVKSESLTAES